MRLRFSAEIDDLAVLKLSRWTVGQVVERYHDANRAVRDDYPLPATLAMMNPKITGFANPITRSPKTSA